MGKKKPQRFQSEHKRQITEKGCKTRVPQCSPRHNLQQVGRGSNLDVRCGTYTRWSITQP